MCVGATQFTTHHLSFLLVLIDLFLLNCYNHNCFVKSQKDKKKLSKDSWLIIQVWQQVYFTGLSLSPQDCFSYDMEGWLVLLSSPPFLTWYLLGVSGLLLDPGLYL